LKIAISDFHDDLQMLYKQDNRIKDKDNRDGSADNRDQIIADNRADNRDGSNYFLATQTGMTNKWLKDQGLLSIKALWVHIHYPATAS
jgi:hypothetical protein